MTTPIFSTASRPASPIDSLAGREALLAAQITVLEAEAAKWRRLSRKHEARAKKAHRQLAKAEGKLASIKNLLA